MIRALSAELLKLRKRPAMALVALILVALVLLFSYAILYLVVRTMPAEAAIGAPDPQDFLDFLLPRSIAAGVASTVSQYGGALALVLGALISGSEYSWRTLGTISIQGPPRPALMGAKVIATVAGAGVLAVVGLASVAAGTYVVALFEGGPYAASPLGHLVGATAIAWLVLSTWGLIGLALGVVLRGPAIAIGIGLVYSFVLESAMAFVPTTVPGASAVRRAMLGSNVTALAELFPAADAFTAMMPTGPDISAAAAVAVLSAYAAAAALAATVLFARRELA